MAKVVVAFNRIHPETLDSRPVDTMAESDTEETINNLKAAIESGGHSVELLEADENIFEQLKKAQPEIVFNIAEGLRGESRESHIPVVCEMLDIHYTGSGPLTLALCLNKARTKEILLHYNISTPKFQVLQRVDQPLNPDLHYPLIVKLLQEGSSMGVSEKSIVSDAAALKEQISFLFNTYHEPLLVEEFIEGREFTVGVMGNAKPRVLPITELVFSKPRGIVIFTPDAEMIERYPQLWKDGIPQPMHRSVCPAEVPPELKTAIEKTAVEAYRALGCRDWCRMEMRLAADGKLYVLELNPIAGIDASYWLPRAAMIGGQTYAEFVNEILDHALARRNHNNHKSQ
ncbi:MAG TPA: hypothetical protein PKM21_18090 [Anaerolineales bacterium]|nr:hypothetical protein [Anaerolineales bacterium]